MEVHMDMTVTIVLTGEETGNICNAAESAADGEELDVDERAVLRQLKTAIREECWGR